MQGQTFSEGDYARPLRSRWTASVVLCASLIFVVWIEPTAAIAQAISPIAPPAGMFAASPLATPSTGPATIPLGSTEIATPGISPIVPSQSASTGTCAGSQSAGPPGTFDGGGISNSASLSCTDGNNALSALPSTSSTGRGEIPLGATELGAAGISSAAPVAGPALEGGAATTTSTSGNP
jgi:hypothetical protein